MPPMLPGERSGTHTMAAHVEPDSSEGVEFIFEDDLVTARDVDSGVASCGGSKAEALAMLAEALELHEGGGEPIEDEGAFLREIGIDPEEIPDEPRSLPDFLQ